MVKDIKFISTFVTVDGKGEVINQSQIFKVRTLAWRQTTRPHSLFLLHEASRNLTNPSQVLICALHAT